MNDTPREASQLVEALLALEEYGHAHARVRLAYEAASLYLKENHRDLVARFEEVVGRNFEGYWNLSGDDIDFWSPLWEETVLDLLEWDVDGDSLSEEEIAHMKEAVRPFFDGLRLQHERLAGAEQGLFVPHREACHKLLQWLASIRSGDGSEASTGWPQVIRTWREAVGLTKLEAAKVLDVSQSTIVRYENQTRCPSVALMGELLGRIATRPNPLAGEALQVWESLRRLAVTLGVTPDAIGASVGTADDEKKIRDEIDDALDRVDLDGLRLIRAVASDPTLGRELIEWADAFKADTRTELVAQKLSRMSSATTAGRGERP